VRRFGYVAAIGIWSAAAAISPVLASPGEPPLQSSLSDGNGHVTRIARGSPATLCRTLGTDDRLRPIPASLVPAARRLFELHTMPAAWIRRSTLFRCFDRHVLICNLGANLPCGKADTSRSLPAADKWCAGHPGSDFIPMYVTGHDTIYRWHCAGSRAAVGGTPLKTDRRGFIARFWKRVDPATDRDTAR
jgi:hypothetical protein